ncbi:MAG: hypothetical protein NTV74_02885 [Euryarchaeota archaeon]|nr:hypothetical protein [Euryarchaeota archaeon]
MKKLLPLVVVGILVLTGLEAVAIPLYKNSGARGDEIDQSMTSYDGVLPLGRTNIFGYYANLSVAQSFIPQKEIQTRAQFLMARNATTLYPCWLAIRDNLTTENLAIISVQPNAFPLVNGTPTEEQLAWVEFDFKDIKITPGHTYYIVMYTSNVTENYYWISGNGTNVYTSGTVYLSIDDGATWSEFPGGGADACFKTYGRNNEAPETPSIDGPAKGKVGKPITYTFVTDDPDGDEVYYCINWSDGTPEVCIGPFVSGEEVTSTHTWSVKGTYVIKAKASDIYDAESDWGTLSVSMPRTGTSLFNRLIERFSHAFPILRHLLGV